MSQIFEGEHGLDLARRALAEMATRHVAPSPENYFVWASHLSGQIPALSREITRMIEAGEAFDAAACTALFEKYSAHASVGDALAETGGQMHDQIAEALAALKAAGRNTRAYEETLEGASDELATLNDPNSLKLMVSSLADATRQMQTQSNELEQKLHDTTREVEQLRANLEKVREEATTDALTGVANRKRFDERLARAVADAHADGSALSLIFADIDHFKSFNDNWGHQTGDQIIRFVAVSMVNACPEGGLVARYGGEEFAIIAPGVALEDAVACAERMRKSVEGKTLKKKSTNEQVGRVTISLGAALLRPGENVWELVERADKCLYASKSKGRNRTTSEIVIHTSASAA